jgi:hypothetical protein
VTLDCDPGAVELPPRILRCQQSGVWAWRKAQHVLECTPILFLPRRMMTRSSTFMAASLFLVLLAGCASGPPLAQNRMAATAPMLSVERFLLAANTSDLEAMARIFGTASGPIADQTGSTVPCAFRRMGSWIGLASRCLSWVEIELRMDAIARLLEHDDYRVQSESSVAGRTRPTVRIGVDVDRSGSRYSNVPFVVVQTSDGSWLVEEIGLERLTSSVGRASRTMAMHSIRAGSVPVSR